VTNFSTTKMTNLSTNPRGEHHHHDSYSQEARRSRGDQAGRGPGRRDGGDRRRYQAEAHEAEAARELADAKAKEAEKSMTTAQADADRILREARTEAGTLTAESRDASHRAGILEGHVRGLVVAQREQADADEADQLAAGLSAERSQLLARIAELCETADRVQGERQEIDAQLAGASRSANSRLVKDLLGDLAGRERIAADADAELRAARDRSTQIGDGTASFPGELLDALSASERHHAAVRKILNDIDPDRPEATADRLAEDIRLGLEAMGERLANPPKPQVQRHAVRL